MDNKISVIVPVYNSAKYLERCFLSLKKQTFKNIQVIFVDDGSKDGSSKICDSFIEESNGIDIKVIHTDNKGVSHARNVGIDAADCDLIAFLDSDDYVAPDFYECLYEKLPVFALGKIIVDDGSVQKVIKEENLSIFVENPDDISCFVVGDNEKVTQTEILKTRVFGSVCRSLFYKDAIVENNLRFNEDLTVGEDLIFLLQYLKNVQKMLLINADYFYNKNYNSATSKLCSGYLVDFLKKYKPLTDCIIAEISCSNIEESKKKKVIQYQKMKFCLSFVTNEILLSEKRPVILKNFFREKENKNYLAFSIRSIKTLESISRKRAILLWLIKMKMWNIIRFLLRKRKHA